MDRKCRWGLLGTAGIGRKNWMSIFCSGNGQINGVASRNLERSKQYIDECQQDAAFPTVPTAYGSYQELLDSDQIDAVYIPLPTGARKQWVIAAAEAGKHVLCEKPCGVGVADMQEMIDACRKNNVQLMDGVMFMHSDRLPLALEALKDKKRIGRLNRIASAFSFRAPDEFFTENIRSQTDLEPHGCLGDLGWYQIRMAILACDSKLPKWVRARTLKTQSADSPIPTDYHFEMGFELEPEHEVIADCYCSFLTHHQQWIHFSGSEGVLRMQDFVLPYEGDQSIAYSEVCDFQQNGCIFIMKRDQQVISAQEKSNTDPTAQEAKMFAKMGQIALTGKTEDFWPEIALKTQIVMNACREAEKNPGQTLVIQNVKS